jgi:hypothetical protein
MRFLNLDQINAKRVLAGMPVITLQEYKQHAKEEQERLQKMISDERERRTNDPVFQEGRRRQGNCGINFVPVGASAKWLAHNQTLTLELVR